jgi:hypothetical protein
VVKDTDHGYRALMKRLGVIGNVTVYVGVRGQEGPVTIDRPDILSIATWNEFGTRRIPERSFLRATADQNAKKYERLLEAAVERMVDGVHPQLAFGLVGEVAVGDVQRRIKARIPPPNAPSTIASKGSDVPLIDTGRLRQSIDYKVEVLR